MNATDQLQLKKALEILNKMPEGLPDDILVEQVGIAVAKPLTTLSGQLMLHTLLERKWTYTYTNTITEQTRNAITDSGRVAMLGL